MTIRKPPHPPPIHVQKVECIAVLQNALTAISNYKYSLSILRNNEVKISSENSCHYDQIVQFLNTKETQYYTFKPKEQKGYRVILRNIHPSTDEA